MRQFINEKSKGQIGVWWDIRIKYFIPAAILYMLGFEIYERVDGPYGEFHSRSQELLFGWGVLLFILVVGLVLAALRKRLPTNPPPS